MLALSVSCHPRLVSLEVQIHLDGSLVEKRFNLATEQETLLDD